MKGRSLNPPTMKTEVWKKCLLWVSSAPAYNMAIICMGMARWNSAWNEALRNDI